MERRFAVYSGVGVAFLVILGVGFGLSPPDDFCPRNSGWNGLSEFESRYDFVRVSSLEGLDGEVMNYSDSVLFIMGPEKEFSPSEAEIVEKFLTGGGRVVLADDFGSGNDLLKGLSIDGEFSGSLLVDPLFKFRDRKLPDIHDVESSVLTGGVDSLGFNFGTVLSGLGGEFEVLAESSEFSFLVENLNEENRMVGGGFPVLAQREVGSGDLVLASDSSLFLNGVIGRENNEVLLGNLVGDQRVLLDVYHWDRSRFWVFQNILLRVGSVFWRREVRYGFLVLIVVIIFKLGLVGRKGAISEMEESDDISRVLEKHPDWDRGTLERLKEGEG